MKIAVITRHAIINYGSLLQTIATQKIINKLGHECQIIDYIEKEENYKNVEKTLLKNKKNWSSNPIKKILYLMLRQPASVYAGQKFEKMRKEYLKLTHLYETREELINDLPRADAYLTGSDQVWGPMSNGNLNGIYFLDFVKSNKKLAFSASFGRTEYSKENIVKIKKWVTDYNHIAVRENSAVDLLKSMGIDAEQVLDPTLMISSDEWKKLINKDINKKYILVYQLHNDKNLNQYAKEVSKRTGLPILRVSPYFFHCSRGGKLVLAPKLGKFLSLIKNATYMITDSFHGTAFAINFNTQFIEILPNNKTNSRNQSILQLTKLDDRIVRDFTDFTILNHKIDFSYANNVLEVERQKSFTILKEMLNE